MSDADQSVHIELVTAAATGAGDAVARALEAGANVHYEDDLALRAAVFTGHEAIAGFLLEKGANVHAAGEEALFYAAKRGDDETVSLLLGHGAIIKDMIQARRREITPECIETLNRHESKRLHEAFQQNFKRVKKPETGNKFKLNGRPPSP